METIKVGDVVTRRSYGEDITFMVHRMIHRVPPMAELKGVGMRLWADSPVEDLVRKQHRYERSAKASSGLGRLIQTVVFQRMHQSGMQAAKPLEELVSVPGKVLHVDGEQHYLAQCRELYNHLSVPVVGVHCPESKQAEEVVGLLERHRPDILVLTGHDGLLRKQSSREYAVHYRSSRYFIEAVKQARLYESDRDGLVIIAGACQSYFEALMDAGANFASSPHRVMVHCVDPVLVAEKIAFTSFGKIVDIREAVAATMSGSAGIGGLETKGTLRQGIPNLNGWGQ